MQVPSTRFHSLQFLPFSQLLQRPVHSCRLLLLPSLFQRSKLLFRLQRHATRFPKPPLSSIRSAPPLIPSVEPCYAFVPSSTPISAPWLDPPRAAWRVGYVFRETYRTTADWIRPSPSAEAPRRNWGTAGSCCPTR